MATTICGDARQLGLLTLLALLACAAPRPAERAATRPGASRAEHAAIAGASDRTDADHALDPGRRPAEMLDFLRIATGMRVAEIGAAGGYTTELLARAVGPGGTVFAQNSKLLLSMVGDEWRVRLARAAMRPVVPVEREFEAPLPPEARDLELVVMNAMYHDTIWIGTDRARMNRAIFEALAPGGAFVVIDSSARPGADSNEAAYELHRVDVPLHPLRAVPGRGGGEEAPQADARGARRRVDDAPLTAATAASVAIARCERSCRGAPRCGTASRASPPRAGPGRPSRT